jgi:hypothetical protein
MDYLNAFRRNVLEGLGIPHESVARLREYNNRTFILPADPAVVEFPLEDEPSVELWRRYAWEAEESGIECLARYLVQLRFPIGRGMSCRPEYVAATRYGAAFEENAHLPCAIHFHNPRGVRIWIHPTPAGSIPIWLAENRWDFIALLHALLYRNEPIAVSDALGAYIVSGFRNWHRYYSEPVSMQAAQMTDRFLVLSSGSYSGIPADALKISAAEWREMSVQIRLEHECAHYFTRRLFGSMANNLYDEILADYYGIVRASGAYHAEWALRFLGIELDGSVRPGARLHRYVPADFTETDLRCLGFLAVRATANLERFDTGLPRSREPLSTALVIWSLAALSLEELACGGGAELIAEKFQTLEGIRCDAHGRAAVS